MFVCVCVRVRVRETERTDKWTEVCGETFTNNITEGFTYAQSTALTPTLKKDMGEKLSPSPSPPPTPFQPREQTPVGLTHGREGRGERKGREGGRKGGSGEREGLGGGGVGREH